MFRPKNPEITVGVIDDDIFEEDEYFYVHLSNPRVAGYPETGAAPLDSSVTPKAVLGDNHTATVTIYDDDHAGKSSPGGSSRGPRRSVAFASSDSDPPAQGLMRRPEDLQPLQHQHFVFRTNV